MPMGIVFAGGTVSGSSGEKYLTDAALTDNTSANEAIEALEAQMAGTKTLTKQQISQITAVLGETVASLSGNDSSPIGKRIYAICAEKGSHIPTKQAPVTTAMPIDRLKAAIDFRASKTLPVDKIKANPSPATFPGAVPAEAKRQTKTITIDTSVPEWHGVGLYAPPGEVIMVTVPAEYAGKGYGVRIGEHTDTLWNLDKWERFPDISNSHQITIATTRVVNAFGGTIFIEVPQRSSLGNLLVTISGAVEAPRFIRGVTTKEEWVRKIRSTPGPWAELQGNLVCISIPSYALRDLDDPEALMQYRDEVMENCCTLYAAPKRKRPERYCVDVQISAG